MSVERSIAPQKTESKPTSDVLDHNGETCRDSFLQIREKRFEFPDYLQGTVMRIATQGNMTTEKAIYLLRRDFMREIKREKAELFESQCKRVLIFW